MKRSLIPQTSIRLRLYLAMVVMLVPLALLGVGAFALLQRTITTVDDVLEETSKEIEPILRLQVLVQRVVYVAHISFLFRDTDPGQSELIPRLSEAIDQAFDAVHAGPFALDQERRLVRAAHVEWENGRRILEVVQAADALEGLASHEIERLHTHIDRTTNLLSQVHTLAQREIAEKLDSAYATQRRALLAIAGTFLAGIGAVAIVGRAWPAPSSVRCTVSRNLRTALGRATWPTESPWWERMN